MASLHEPEISFFIFSLYFDVLEKAQCQIYVTQYLSDRCSKDLKLVKVHISCCIVYLKHKMIERAMGYLNEMVRGIIK